MKLLYWSGYALSKTIAKIGFRYRAFGQENIIEDGPAIMAANHQSYFDPPLVGITCRAELHYLARKTLFENKLFGSILSRVNALPVDLISGKAYPGDLFLLCSDGLSDMVGDTLIAEKLAAERSLEEKADRLVRTAGELHKAN